MQLRKTRFRHLVLNTKNITHNNPQANNGGGRNYAVSWLRILPITLYETFRPNVSKFAVNSAIEGS